ncbi:Condensin-2 complex subunit G2 [Desmophyllum pertusum]|uniref:Condensin-2 complex subunit G2 n=1 Tax=Desmophyllum pertusum TaxID=174260 RepID=A0A9X0CP43_9CNID|nr:Condensin-2 complex subunit G2 [Desmophyllum pertusum]
MNLREQFLKSVGEDSPQAFLGFMEQHNSKNESFDVEELLQTLPKKDHERLWSGLRDMTHRLLLTNPVGSQENIDSADEESLGVTAVALCALATPEKASHTPSALLETAVILHGLLMVLPEGAETLQNNIAQLCELWFLNELEGKEELVTQTFPYLIIRSLSRGFVSDVKRVWSLRQSLLLMDFEDNSSESLKQLLHQCMIHPMYLKLEEVLEENCVQDLMFSAVHAQRTGTQSMASRLRKVLEYFHQQKKQRGVDEALLRLYQPIIWRAFKVANLWLGLTQQLC